MSRMLVFNLSVEGERSLRAGLQVSIDRIKDLRPAWELIRDDFAARTRSWLDSEGEGSFAPLSDNPPGAGYATWKQRHHPGLPILRLSGRLRRSLSDPDDPEFLYRPERLAVALGTTVPYARFHQRGTSRMPRRPPLHVTKNAASSWAKIIHQHLFETGQLRRAPALRARPR